MQEALRQRVIRESPVLYGVSFLHRQLSEGPDLSSRSCLRIVVRGIYILSSALVNSPITRFY